MRCCFKGDNMKDKTESIIGVIICAAVLYMSVGTRIYDSIRQKIKTASAANSVETYISDKYGFIPENIEVNGDPWFDSDSGHASFKASDGSRSFKINYDEYGGELFCRDDYQQEEIYSAAEKYINENLENGKVYYMYLGCENPFTGDIYLGSMDKDTVFDGGNISNIMEKCSGELEMVFYGTESLQPEIFHNILELDIDIEAASFDTKEHMDEFYNAEREKNQNYYYSYFDEQLEKYAPHITDYLKIDSGTMIGDGITVQENDNFRYACFLDSLDSPEVLKTSQAEITAEPAAKHTLTEAFAAHGEEKWLKEPITETYSFKKTYGNKWIYYPLES